MRTDKSRSAYLTTKIVRFPEGLDGSTEQTHAGILPDSDEDVKTFCLCGLATVHLTGTRKVCMLRMQYY